MAESAAFSRRGYLGGCVATTIPAGLAAGATSATLADASTWAGLTTNGPARLMLGRTGATPEEIEISLVSGNAITISARGLQGTSDTTHAADVTCEVIHSPRDFNEANAHIADTTLDHHTQYLKVSSAAAAYQPIDAGLTDIAAIADVAGDIIIRGAAGWQRLAKSATATAVLRAGATYPEWAVDTVSEALAAAVATSETTTSTTYTDLATAGPAVTVTTGTKALVIVSCTMGGATGLMFMASAVSGATTNAAADDRGLALDAVSAHRSGSSFVYLFSGLTAGANTFTAKYRVVAGTGTFYNRRIDVVNMGS